MLTANVPFPGEPVTAAHEGQLVKWPSVVSLSLSVSAKTKTLKSDTDKAACNIC